MWGCFESFRAFSTATRQHQIKNPMVRSLVPLDVQLLVAMAPHSTLFALLLNIKRWAMGLWSVANRRTRRVLFLP
jgi:hypothetical protein